jgi:outer membrane lipoprotein-sorting protein
MKVSRIALSVFMLSLCVLALGQSSATPVAGSGAQSSFDLLKSLAGTWKGSVTTDNAAWATDQPMPLSIRVASHGNAMIHELSTPGPEVTVFYLDSDRLTLMHYCDFGNRPHMVARPQADGKTVEFDLMDAPGSNQVGHVSHAVFTVIDANHHIEDWTFTVADGTIVHAHLDFKRVQ